jgi:hypothetical protein
LTYDRLKILTARTYGRLHLGFDEVGVTVSEIKQLPWVRAGVATVHITRFGFELRLGGSAGRLLISERLAVDVQELVPGTASACLELSTGGRRQDRQSAAEGIRVSPGVALAEAFVTELEGAGPPHKDYMSTVEPSSRPRGKILISESIRGLLAHGRPNQLVTRRRYLSEDTPVNRLLLAAAVRAERILDGARSPKVSEARHWVVALSGARLIRDVRSLGLVIAAGDEMTELISVAMALMLGVPVLPPPATSSSSPFTTWVRLDVLFEEAVRSVCERACRPGSVTLGRSESMPLFHWQEGDPPRSSRRADPDVVVRSAGKIIVLDAKYRRTGEQAEEHQLYQLIAHAGAFQATACALVTPAINSEPGTARLGRTATGATVDIISVDASNARNIDRSLRGWLSKQGVIGAFVDPVV